MDNTFLAAATAIRDMECEGKVAATLSRLGLRVIHRATSLEGLHECAINNPEVMVIASDDFKGIENFAHSHLLMLEGNTSGKSTYAHPLPETDAEFLQLIQSIQLKDQARVENLPYLEGEVITITSIGRDTGCTTFAINYAAELSARGESVLLIDAHIQSPSVALCLGLHGLRERVLQSDFGFSLTEIQSMNDIQRIISESRAYTKIVIDLGELVIDSRTSTGRRLDDLVATWTLRCTTKLNIVTSKRDSHLREMASQISLVKNISEISQVYIVIILKEFVSKKTLETVLNQVEGATIFSHDRRAIEKFELTRQPLISSCPKSYLRREMEEWVSRLEG